jgi:hypothetical protein
MTYGTECQCCSRFVRKISDRWWCSDCESEFATVMDAARAKVSAFFLMWMLSGIKNSLKDSA